MHIIKIVVTTIAAPRYIFWESCSTDLKKQKQIKSKLDYKILMKELTVVPEPLNLHL